MKKKLHYVVRQGFSVTDFMEKQNELNDFLFRLHVFHIYKVSFRKDGEKIIKKGKKGKK